MRFWLLLYMHTQAYAVFLFTTAWNTVLEKQEERGGTCL